MIAVPRWCWCQTAPGLLLTPPCWWWCQTEPRLLLTSPCWWWCQILVDADAGLLLIADLHLTNVIFLPSTLRDLCAGAEWRNHCLSHAHLPKVCFHEVSIISRDFISETRANITLFHMHELETEHVIIFITSSQIIFIFISSSHLIIIIENQKLWRVVEIWTQLKQTLYLVIINHDQTIQDSRTLLCQYVLLPNSLALHCL